MPDLKLKKRKGFIILLIIIAVYALIVSGIAIYYKIENSSYHTEYVEQEDNTSNTPNPSANLDEIESRQEDEAFEKEYAAYLEKSTLADVPAKVAKEEEMGFWANILYSIYSFFGLVDKDIDNKVVRSAEHQKMLAELDAAIAEIQPMFKFYVEDNGVTYIDHINKPIFLESFGFYVYIGIRPDNYVFHRTIIRYSGKERIDLQNILVQTDISDRALIISATNEVYQHQETSQINEWIDIPPTIENNDLLNTVISSNKVKVTFMGIDRKIEWELSQKEMEALRQSLYFYNLLKEKEELVMN